jgi:L-ribulose-5-phosphate 4-epimerase
MDKLKRVKNELTEVAHKSYLRGLQTGNGGNLSARVPGEEIMIIKASGYSFADCSSDSWIITDLDGNVLEGNRGPSREYPVHALIYKKCSEINCVIHVHSPFGIAIAEICEHKVPEVAYHSRLKLGSSIPILKIDAPNIEGNNLNLVESLFNNYPSLGGFIHRRHGSFALGKSCIDAFYNLELMEETAKTTWLVKVALK